ncbi:MAG: AAA family ATPase [Chloroflexota bacterium]|nr:AAA family ATPase [Chloroflexota bacterium]
MSVRPEQRFRRDRPCPVCGGYPEAPHGRGVRCWGFLSEDGTFAHCTREERAGSLQPHEGSNTYAHRLTGECGCGTRHGAAAEAVTRSRTWRLTHPIGTLVEHHREDRADGTKRMWWERDGKLGLRGLRVADLPLYGADELRELPQDSRVFVVAGEKARDALKRLVIPAVATVTGEKTIPSDQSLRALLDYVPVLWPDNDEDGEMHMRRIAERLCGLGHENVRCFAWSDAPPAGDAADFFACGGTRVALEKLADAAPLWSDALAGAENASAAPRNGVAAERNRPLAFRSAPEFAARTPESPPWLLTGYIARGAIAELVGKVKAAGKTTLVLAMCRAIVRGEDFAGRRTERAGVVFLTEQPDASFREALARADLLDAESFTVLSWHDSIGVPWPEVVAQAVAACKARDAGLLVTDTLPQWAGIRGDGENNAGEALEAIAPLQEAAGIHRLAVVVLRHSRKSGGDVGDDGRGSSAFAGAVDVVLSLRRPEGNTEPNVRILHGLSRFADTPESLALQLTPDGYVALGSEVALAFEVAKRQVLEVAPRIAEHALTSDELLDAAKVRRTSGQEAVAALLKLGQLVRTGEGKRGSPYRYYALSTPEMLHAATTSLGRHKETGDDGRPSEPGARDRFPSETTNGVPSRDDDPMLRAAHDLGLVGGER